MLVVVKDRAVSREDAHHRLQAFPLPRHVIGIGHTILVDVVFWFGTVAGRIAEVVRRRRDDQPNRPARHTSQEVEAIALVDGVEP